MAKILPVFLPFASCGNKCIFCEQQAITSVKAESDLVLLANRQINKWLSYSTNYDEIAFYGGNFAAINKNIREQLYKLAYNNKLYKIRFSTRPDTINNDTLAEIKDYNIFLVELGIQSLDDNVLLYNGRPYTSTLALKSIDNILNITNCGVQLMAGMYKQKLHSSIEDAKILSQKNIKTARIYPTQVIKNTELYNLYVSGEYTAFDLESMILSSGGMFIHFMAEDVQVIRMGLPEDAINNNQVVAGVHHPSFGDIIKTFVVLLYMNMGGKIKYSGFKKVGKKLFVENFKLYNSENSYNFNEICKELREYYLEDSKRFVKGQAVTFARELKSATND